MRRLPGWASVALAAAAGLALEVAFAGLERAFGAGLVASVLVEEGGKFLLLLGLALAGRLGTGPEGPEDALRDPGPALRRERARALRSGRMACLGLVAIAVFAAAENLSYFMAFPGGDILGRLLWSEPVHLVSGVAEAVAAVALARLSARAGGAGRPGAAAGRLAEMVLMPAFAVAWHLAFNLLADAAPAALFPGGAPSGAMMALAAAANAAALLLLIRYFVQRVIVGGFLYGDG